MFHELSFKIEDEFSDIYSYNERKIHFMKTYQPKVKDLRKAFLVDYYNNPTFAKEYHDYMDIEQDYIFFTNLNFSAVDQRKFGKKWYIKNIGPLKGNTVPKVRFTAFWYQIVLWEIYTRYSVAYWKSRDVGLSFSIIAGETMSLLHNGGTEVIFLSKTEKDVDITDDRTQTNMGRTRAGIEDSAIYSLNDLKDKYLMLYSDSSTGIKGSNIVNGGRQGRFGRGFNDEAGIQKKIGDVVEAIKMATTTTIFAGTLKIGTDAGFRKIIESGYKVEKAQLRKLFDDFKELDRKGVSYTKAWDAVFQEFDKSVPNGLLLSFTNTYEDHPMKSGNCDYFMIESNNLLNDEVIIAHELLADLNAGTPDRSFYSATNNHIENITLEDFENVEILMGFDPGSHGTAAMTPIIIDNYGFYYILETEVFERGSMKEWLDKLINKYGWFTVFAEQSVKAYSKSGAGWMSFLRGRNLKTVIVSNRDMDDQLLVVNELFREKRYNEQGEEELMIKVSDKNKWWLMSYIYGEKYSDIEQRKMSHPAESMISVLFQLNKEILSGVRYKASTA
jgi:hypothetical protein